MFIVQVLPVANCAQYCRKRPLDLSCERILKLIGVVLRLPREIIDMSTESTSILSIECPKLLIDRKVPEIDLWDVVSTHTWRLTVSQAATKR